MNQFISQKCLKEMQPSINGHLRRAGEGYVFAEITNLKFKIDSRQHIERFIINNKSSKKQKINSTNDKDDHNEVHNDEAQNEAQNDDGNWIKRKETMKSSTSSSVYLLSGTARCHVLRITISFDETNVVLKTVEQYVKPLTVGPIQLPILESTSQLHAKHSNILQPQLASKKTPYTILYGKVYFDRSNNRYRFVKCSPANELHFLHHNMHESVSFFRNNMDQLQLDSSNHDLFVFTALIHRDFNIVLEFLKTIPDFSQYLPSTTNLTLSVSLQDFAALTCIYLRDVTLYSQLIQLIKRKREILDGFKVKRFLYGAVATRVLSLYIEKLMTQCHQQQKTNEQETIQQENRQQQQLQQNSFIANELYTKSNNPNMKQTTVKQTNAKKFNQKTKEIDSDSDSELSC